MTDISFGIAVDVSDPARSNLTISLAVQAELENFDLVVLTSADSEASSVAGLDVATVASWVLALTSRIAVGIDVSEAIARDSDVAPRELAAKAQATIDLLAGARLVTSEADWEIASLGAELPELEELARTGRTVVVPTLDPAEMFRVAMLRDSMSDVPVSSWRRAPAAKARRRPGIDYEGIPRSLSAHERISAVVGLIS